MIGFIVEYQEIDQVAYDDVCKARGRHVFMSHGDNWLVCEHCGYSQRKDQFPDEWPYNEFDLSVPPTTVILTDDIGNPAGWSVIVYAMVTGRYGCRVVERTKDGEVERAASGAFDQPWNALRYASSILMDREG